MESEDNIHKLSTRNLTNHTERRKPDYASVVMTIFTGLMIIGGLWGYSLNISQTIGVNYAHIKSQLDVMSEKVDYLVKSNDQLSDFKDRTNEKLAVHESEIKLIRQEINNMKDRGNYNEINSK